MDDETEGPARAPRASRADALLAAARRHPRKAVAAALVAVAAIAAIVVALVLTMNSGPPRGLVASLDLPKKSVCGNKLVGFKRLPEIGRWVFPLDGTWHHTKPCMRDLLAAAEKQPPDAPIHAFLRDQVLFILSQKPVRFYRHEDGTQKSLGEVLTGDRELDFTRFDRVVYVNRRDVAHNSMSHVDLVQSLFEAARIYLTGPYPDPARASVYESLGAAVIAVVLDPVEERGLRTRLPCDLRAPLQCSWFHAVTNRNRDASDVGGTLNKNLQVIRDLNRSAVTLAGIQSVTPSPERASLIASLEVGSAEGINQLVYSSGLNGPKHTPNLFDYLPRNAEGAPIEKAWLYYAINVPKARGYYLRREYWKNCSYHIIDMTHLHFILKEAGHLTDTGGFREPSALLGGKSILHFILDTYIGKLDGPDGLYKDTPTVPDGSYVGCKEGFKPPAPQFVVDYLRDY